MNFTRDYHDELDGEHLACKPGDVADGLVGVCTLGIPIVGSAALLNGLYCVFVVYIMRRHRKLLVIYTRDAAHEISNFQNSPKFRAMIFV